MVRRCCVVCFAVLLFGAFAFTASAVETAPVPSETVALPDSASPSELSVSDDSISLYASVSSDSLTSGLACYHVDSNLGIIHLFLPLDFTLDVFRLDNGSLYNMSNSSVYLYCSEFPSYTFWANRFGVVQYRPSGSFQETYSLTNVSLVDSVPASASLSAYVVPFLLLLILASVLLVWVRR